MTNNHNIFQAFQEFTSGFEKIPSLANLCDVLLKADTPYRRSIAESEIDRAIDSWKDFQHLEITNSRNYASESQREYDKQSISLGAEIAKLGTKDYLRVRGLLQNI